jgi:hypothetical protein
MNSAPVDSPWLTMYSTAPVIDSLVKAKIPSPMKPKCDTEVYETSRLRSRCPMASSAP